MKPFITALIVCFIAAAIGGLYGKYYDAETSQFDRWQQQNFEAQARMRDLRFNQ